jgi:hypothetical protein
VRLAINKKMGESAMKIRKTPEELLKERTG